jgi:hypothetical protein
MLAINILSSLCKRYLSAAVGCEFFFSFAYVMFLMIEVTVEHKRPNSSQIHSLLHFFGLFICFLYDYMFCIRTLFYKFCVGLGVWWMSLLAHKIMLCSKVSQINASFSSTPLNWIPPSKHLNLWRKKKKLFLKKRKDDASDQQRGRESIAVYIRFSALVVFIGSIEWQPHPSAS